MISSEDKLKCSTCLELLSLDSFAKYTSSKRGYQYSCKACYRVTHKVYRQKPGFKESRLVYQQKWCSENQDLMRGWQLKKYGITQDDYESMLEKQNHSCKICETHIDCIPQKQVRKMKYGLHVDHSHITGKVRGLLCFKCNSVLGHLKDDISLFEKCITYLKESDGDS